MVNGNYSLILKYAISGEMLSLKHTCMMGVLWQIFLGVFYRPSARHASPPVDKKTPKKFATKRPIIHVCKAETSY